MRKHPEVSIRCVGYYSHGNAGDEQYKLSLAQVVANFFPSGKVYRMTFHDADSFSAVDVVSDDDIIVVGGGDVLNTYFLSKLNAVVQSKTGNTVIAMCAGIPYLDIVTSPLLDAIDYFFMRSKSDVDILQTARPGARVHYVPDLSVHLSSRSAVHGKTRSAREHGGRKVLGVCLARPAHNPEFPVEYQNVCKKIARALEGLVHAGRCRVVLIPFNTNASAKYENDTVMNADVMAHIPERARAYVSCVEPVHPLDTFRAVGACDATLCMRYHSVLFSVANGVPFVALHSTRKVDCFLRDTMWDYKQALIKNERDVPVDMDVDDLVSQVSCVLESAEAGETVKNIHAGLLRASENALQNVVHAMLSPKPATAGRSIVRDARERILAYVSKRGYANVHDVADEQTKDVVVKMVSYALTGTLQSQYNHGLLEKMFERGYNYVEEWNWVLTDSLKRNDADSLKKRTQTKTETKWRVALSPTTQFPPPDVHRSGWNYVCENVARHVNLLRKSDAGTLPMLDLFVDGTFHWNLGAARELGLIPYRKEWTGIVHHTFDDSFSSYNSKNLFQCPEFVESLEKCRGLVVLTEYLAGQFREALKERGLDRVPVHVIPHPTELTVPQFSMQRFLANEEKKLVHVGGWLRNIVTFYTAAIPERIGGGRCASCLPCGVESASAEIRKSVLKGKDMNNYFPGGDFLERIAEALLENGRAHDGSVSRGGENGNNFYRHFLQATRNALGSVDVLSYLNDTEYDRVLAENVVFINLIDASAVNTIIECVARNTPIVVNRHPAVEEVLGKGYPLMYENISEVSSLMNVHTITRAHAHLKRLNKSKFSIETFLERLKAVLQG